MMADRGTLKNAERTERGMTLVELMVSLVLSTILGGVGLIVISTYFSAEKVVDTSYANLNQLLPIGTAFQQYIRSAISPAPTLTTSAHVGTPGQPSPPFGLYKTTGALTSGVKFTTNSLVFFTDLRNKIAKVVATYAPTLTRHTHRAVTPPSGTFTVTTTAAHGSCPTSDSTPGKCTFTHSTARTAIRVYDVTNGTDATPPIFTYYLATSASSTPIASFQTCTKTVCDANEIQSVGFDLIVNEDPRVGHTADQETVTYEVSASSQAFNPAVG